MSQPIDTFSLWAFAISLLSLIAAIWSTWVSHKALSHSKLSYEEEKRLTFAREKNELLEVINTSRKHLERAKLEIGSAKAGFDAESEEIKNIMQPFTRLFTEFLPRIEGGLNQAYSLWDEIYAWSDKLGPSALAHHQARFRALVHDDELACEAGLKCLSEFKDKLQQAKLMHYGFGG